jgi:predicted anti-sigma-YlaC factor YlaD
MKTGLALLLGTLALAATTYADSGAVSFVPASNGKGGTILVPVQESTVTSIALVKSARGILPPQPVSIESESIRYVPASNGKGGVALVPEQVTTSIALVKSSGAMCCAQH